MVCDDKWHSVVRLLFFILDCFSINTTCLVKAMVNARIVVNPLFQMIFQFTKPFFFVVCSLDHMRLIRRAWLYGILLVQCLG